MIARHVRHPRDRGLAAYYRDRGLGETPASVAAARQAQRAQRIEAGVDLHTGRLAPHVSIDRQTRNTVE